MNEMIRRATVCERLATLSVDSRSIDVGDTVTGAADGKVERFYISANKRIGAKAKVNGRWYYVAQLTLVQSADDRARRIADKAVSMMLMWDEVMPGAYGKTYGQSFEEKVG